MNPCNKMKLDTDAWKEVYAAGGSHVSHSLSKDVNFFLEKKNWKISLFSIKALDYIFFDSGQILSMLYEYADHKLIS